MSAPVTARQILAAKLRSIAVTASLLERIPLRGVQPVLATNTRELRQALDALDDTIAEAQDALDELETAAGLVDPETGRRTDEAGR